MKKSLLFVNDEMTMGGVARILNNLLSRLNPDEYEIDLLVLHPHGELMREIPDHIHVLESSSFFKGVDVNLKEALRRFDVPAILHKVYVLVFMKTGLITWKIRSERKKLLSKHYDIEFSAKEGFCTIFVSAGDSTKKLNWVQVDYSQQNYSKNHMPLMIQSLQSIDLNIACSNDVEQAYRSLFKTNQIKVIHNFIDDQKIIRLANESIDFTMDSTYFNAITVARFHPQKSVDRLIDAFSIIHLNQPKTRLYIIGDGELRESLISKVNDLKLSDSISFLGMKSNPYPYIKMADMFILSSLYEGYPTIVIESLLSGTPVLSTHVSGVKEQIIQDETGWVVSNTTEAMAEKWLDLINEPSKISHTKLKLLNYHYPNDQILNDIKQELSTMENAS